MDERTKGLFHENIMKKMLFFSFVFSFMLDHRPDLYAYIYIILLLSQMDDEYVGVYVLTERI